MPLVARIVLALCGAVVALYGAASLTGRVTPPWWQRTIVVEDPPDPTTHFSSYTIGRRPVPGREAISVAVGAVGLTLAGFAVLGRRRAEAR